MWHKVWKTKIKNQITKKPPRTMNKQDKPGNQKNVEKQVLGLPFCFFLRCITFLQDYHSLVRSRNRPPYTKKFPANLSGLLTPHEINGFEKLLGV